MPETLGTRVTVLETLREGDKAIHTLQHRAIEDKVDSVGGKVDALDSKLDKCLLNNHPKPWNKRKHATVWGGGSVGFVAIVNVIQEVAKAVT